MSEKRARFQAILDGQAVDRIPTGFWYHFFKDELDEATSQADLIAENVTGHQKFISDFKPDFIKLMRPYFDNRASCTSQSATCAI